MCEIYRLTYVSIQHMRYYPYIQTNKYIYSHMPNALVQGFSNCGTRTPGGTPGVAKGYAKIFKK